MKKLALLFGLMVLSSQFPLSPSAALPGNLMSSLEYGRQWTGMFLHAFGPAEASPAPEAKPAVSGSACPLAQLASLRLPEPPPEMASLPVVPPALEEMQIEVQAPSDAVPAAPVIVQVKAPSNCPEISAEFARNMQQAVQELHLNMKDLSKARLEIVQRHFQIRAEKAAQRLQKLQIIVTSKAA
jgi:hypothetical protein